jgi:hypothetical protein
MQKVKQPASNATNSHITCFRNKTVASECMACEALNKITKPNKVSEITNKQIKVPAGGIRLSGLRKKVRTLIERSIRIAD